VGANVIRPLHASANPKAGSWLLFEHPGPWPARFEEMEHPPPLARVIGAAHELGVRAQLIRRHRSRRTVPPMRVYACSTRLPDPWIETRDIVDLDELDSLDIAALFGHRDSERPVFGKPVGGPLFLVCTNGNRDVRCAQHGRPVAAALSTTDPDAVWETTHVGGHELAANLVCLPHGLYYGRLTPSVAARVVDAYRSGLVVLDNYRGRAGLPQSLQAIEHLVREQTGVMSIDGVAVEPVRVQDGRSEAIAVAEGVRYRTVVQDRTDLPESGCGGCELGFRLLEFTKASP
jgi:hypothetical protein